MNKRVTGSMKHELGGKIMTEFVDIRLKTFSFLIDAGDSIKKLKQQKIV